ncbi:nose resistant to fluoxetine protein 6-like [Amblyomma americanum]
MKLVHVLVVAAAVFGAAVPHVDAATRKKSPELVETIKSFVAKMMNNPNSALTQRLLGAEISPSCMVGLLKLMRGIRNVEPWALRLFDASGKYPTGLFQGSMADLGAFDECVETLVLDEYGNEKIRGQYCNLYLPAANNSELLEYVASGLAMSHPRMIDFAISSSDSSMVEGLRLGICFINDCSQEDIQMIINALAGGTIELRVQDCVTNEPQPWTTAQISIVAFLGTLAVVIAASTVFDYCITKRQIKKGPLQKALSAFSIETNIKLLLNIEQDKDSDASTYRFLHGIRFLSIFSIVLGHSYAFFDYLAMSRAVNALRYADMLGFNFIMTAYNSVDVFFFISGFLMLYNIDKQAQTRVNRLYIYVVAIIRRHLRTTVPVFFVIMCCYLGPVIASGPNLKPLMERIHYEFSRQWWKILLQVRNEGERDDQGFLGVLWFISADFQLFMVAMPTVLILKRSYWGKIAVFGIMGAVCSAVGVWQLHGTAFPPFMMPFVTDIKVLNDFYSDVYVWPFHHGLCYFAGCIVCLLVQKFRHAKISKLKLFATWCLCVFCGLTCFFIKYDWCRGRNPTDEWVKLLVFVANLLCCAIFVGWLVFACATGRGGIASRLLSWKALVPLSRLSFGVYCIHVPIYYYYFALSRERVFYSHFTLVMLSFGVFVLSNIFSFITFIACEAPVGSLEKQALMPSSLPHDSKKRKAATTNGMLHNGATVNNVPGRTGVNDKTCMDAVISLGDISRL